MPFTTTCDANGFHQNKKGNSGLAPELPYRISRRLKAASREISFTKKEQCRVMTTRPNTAQTI
jgi:hypothetical protein